MISPPKRWFRRGDTRTSVDYFGNKWDPSQELCVRWLAWINSEITFQQWLSSWPIRNNSYQYYMEYVTASAQGMAYILKYALIVNVSYCEAQNNYTMEYEYLITSNSSKIDRSMVFCRILYELSDLLCICWGQSYGIIYVLKWILLLIIRFPLILQTLKPHTL